MTSPPHGIQAEKAQPATPTAETLPATLDPAVHSHRRHNPLTGQWVVVSPHRTKRPWSGSTTSHVEQRPSYDSSCYLCPGNTRAGGAVANPDYPNTFVFENDFSALNSGLPAVGDLSSDLFQLETAEGECRVICFSPNHSLTLGDMTPEEIGQVISLWQSQTTELEASHQWVQIFETRGDICGSSNPHPHGQIWASNFMPDEPQKELLKQTEYLAAHGTHLLLDYAEQEMESGDRLVVANDNWMVVVPYWAYWPYETLVLPRRRIASLADLDNADRTDLADVLKRMLQAFNQVFDTPFPYCSGWHSGGLAHRDVWQLHAHYYPPLLRSAEVAKIPASYELLASFQRDFTPEYSAERLRSLISGS